MFRYVDPEDHTHDVLVKAIDNIDVSCLKCVNYNRMDFTCKAFPNGIPSDILTGKVRHDKPYPNDNGIMFEENVK